MSAYGLYVRLTTHPVVEGAAALTALLGALFAPVVLGYGLTVSGGLGAGTAYGLGAMAMLAGVWAFNRVLYRTRVFNWTARLLQWTGSRGITSGGESA